MKYYPIAIKLKNKRAVVVGGGTVAARKVSGLLGAGARVTVISPSLTSELEGLFKKRKVSWLKRKVRRGDIGRADIVIAAASDNTVNKNVSAWAREAGKAVNVVDNKNLSDFISPAVFKKDRAIVAVYTDGKDPVLSRDLRIFLEGHWDEFLSFRNRL